MIVTSNDLKSGSQIVTERNLLLNDALNDAMAADSTSTPKVADKR